MPRPCAKRSRSARQPIGRLDEAQRPVWLAEKTWERAKEDHRQKAIALGLFEIYFRKARETASKETLEVLLEQHEEAITTVNNAALNAAATRTAWEVAARQQDQAIRLARQEEKEAKERLDAIIPTERESREKVEEAADKKSTLEKPEQERWRAAFGRFPAPLELELDGQVIARLELLPPTG